MSPLPNWDDLRYLLAVAEAGSLTRAARRLKVDQATVSRRVRACEEELGTPLLERAPKALTVTPMGHCAIEAAQTMEKAAEHLERRLRAAADTTAGTLTVTATEGLANQVIVPSLCKLRVDHPALTVRLIISNERLRLAQQEADIAVRLERPTEPGIVGRKVGMLAFSLYASETVPGRTKARSGAELSSCSFVGYETSLAQHSSVMGWVDSLGSERVVLRCNTTGSVQAAIAAGIGIGALPRFMGEADPRLRLVTTETRHRPIWLVVHRDLRRSPRVRAGLDFLNGVFREAADRLG